MRFCKNGHPYDEQHYPDYCPKCKDMQEPDRTLPVSEEPFAGFGSEPPLPEWNEKQGDGSDETVMVNRYSSDESGDIYPERNRPSLSENIIHTSNPEALHATESALPSDTVFATKTTSYETPASSASSKDKPTVLINSASSNPATSPPTEAVVGWLVVIDGKGRGQDLRISAGQNRVGRSQGEIILNFGDDTVSREKHALISYDFEGNQFYISSGSGRNLTKINDQVLMGHQELRAFDRILFGKTELCFVPFCGQAFNWDTAQQPTQTEGVTPSSKDV